MMTVVVMFIQLRLSLRQTGGGSERAEHSVVLPGEPLNAVIGWHRFIAMIHFQVWP